MKPWFWKTLLKLSGWKAQITVTCEKKDVICVAPHTSNLDFLIGLIAYRSVGRKANFLMKDFWFFFPLKYLLKALGGIPVKRKNKKRSLTDAIIKDFENSKKLNLAVTPEGTRKAVTDWKTGFLYISYGAKVPIQLGVIDYKNKTVLIKDSFYPSGKISKDMAYVKDYYSRYAYAARYPEKFKF